MRFLIVYGKWLVDENRFTSNKHAKGIRMSSTGQAAGGHLLKMFLQSTVKSLILDHVHTAIFITLNFFKQGYVFRWQYIYVLHKVTKLIESTNLLVNYLGLLNF